MISLPESASREAMTRKANIKVCFSFMLSANAFVHEISAKGKKKPFYASLGTNNSSGIKEEDNSEPLANFVAT